MCEIENSQCINYVSLSRHFTKMVEEILMKLLIFFNLYWKSQI